MTGPHQPTTRICAGCGGDYPLAFYRRGAPECLGCDTTQAASPKQPNMRDKARRTLNTHADRFIRSGFAADRDDFASRYGWDVDRMAADITHTLDGPCPYCGTGFANPGDCTLDIVDPRQAPYYAVNVRWCCRTCNTEKHRTPPDEWGARLLAWQQWRGHPTSEWPADCLFAGLG